MTGASVDIWTGEKDHKLRRISVDVDVDTAEQQDGTIRLDLAVTQLDREQPIGPPANPRPLTELTAALAELGARADQRPRSGGSQDGAGTGASGAQDDAAARERLRPTTAASTAPARTSPPRSAAPSSSASSAAASAPPRV